jgi:hypothetical protein
MMLGSMDIRKYMLNVINVYLKFRNSPISDLMYRDNNVN